MSSAAMTFAQWRSRRRATALSVARAEGLDVVVDDPTLLLACGAAGADRAGFGMSSDAASAHRLLDLLGQGYRPMFVSCIAAPEGIGEALHAFGYEEEDPGELVGMGTATSRRSRSSRWSRASDRTRCRRPPRSPTT